MSTDEGTDESTDEARGEADGSASDLGELAEQAALAELGDPGDQANRADPADPADIAAASALARARDAARAKGLRPGTKPMRRRAKPGQGKGVPGSADSAGRDPSLLGDQMDKLLLDRGWNVDVAVGAVMGRWPEIVGSNIAEHCKPVTFSDGVLTVRADSTAWTTQMRLMSSSILARLEAEVGKDAVTELRVQGPSAPSWSRGPRKSTGPGPRDTYG